MFSWELTLAVRKRVCELRLWQLYDRYGNMVLARKRCPEMGPSWHKKDDVLAALHREIQRELEEIRFLRTLLRAGEARMVLHKQNRFETHQIEPGPSLLELVEQHIENLRSAKPWCEGEFGQGKIEGMEQAIDILRNPYNYLSGPQRLAFDGAQDARDKIVSNRAGPVKASAARAPAGQPGPSLAQARAAASDGEVVRRGKP